MESGAWIERGFEQVQGHADDGVLHVDVIGLAAGIAEWKVGEEKAWYAALFDDVTGGTDDDGGDAVGF